MHRYTHAWITIRAIDRLEAIADQILVSEPEAVDKYNSIYYFVDLIKDKMDLVVEGSWIPDNVIHDNNPGHIWKYEPPLRNVTKYTYKRNGEDYKGCYTEDDDGKRTHFRTDHAVTHSFCFLEAQNTHAFGKYWRKTQGQLVDRIIAVHQTMRDLILFQRDEMLNIVSTLIHKYNNKLEENEAEIIEFLKDPDAMKIYYDEEVDGKFVNREPIISIRNDFRRGRRQDDIYNCMRLFGNHIQKYIELLNSNLFIKGEKVAFPMFFSNDQIALTFFSLGHYISDAHMPLHCDDRSFSSTKCSNIHSTIEETWDKWILKHDIIDELTKNLSETDRGEEFIKYVFGNGEKTWRNFQYPENKTLLRDFDKKLGQEIWIDRPFIPIEDNGWLDLVGTTYASYCLASRLLQFDDCIRAIPEGSKTDYTRDYCGTVEIIKGKKWKSAADEENVEEGLEKYSDEKHPWLNDLRTKIYNYVKEKGGKQQYFKYLSLLILVDAVECTANLWAKTIQDHLRIPYEKV